MMLMNFVSKSTNLRHALCKSCFSTKIGPQELTYSHKKKAIDYCKKYLRGAWLSCSDKIKIEQMPGGLSNYLMYCRLSDDVKPENDEPLEVKIRLFGTPLWDTVENELKQLVTQRVSENVVFTILSERGYGPKIYGSDANGRVEEFVPGRNLSNEELPHHAPIIGKTLSQLHELSMPLSKDRNWLTKNLRIWLKSISNIDINEIDNDVERLIAKRIVPMNYHKEIKWLETKVFPFANSPIVFSHNDFHTGNIILVSENESQMRDISPESPLWYEEKCKKDAINPLVMPIDFEFCSYNYRAFDIAHHFAEWAYDYTNESFPYFTYNPSKYPSDEQQYHFLKSYINEENGSSTENNEIPMEQKLNILMKEVEIFRMVPCLFFGLWSMDMASKVNNTFSYWSYAENCIERYFVEKSKLVRKVPFIKE